MATPNCRKLDAHTVRFQPFVHDFRSVGVELKLANTNLVLAQPENDTLYFADRLASETNVFLSSNLGASPTTQKPAAYEIGRILGFARQGQLSVALALAQDLPDKAILGFFKEALAALASWDRFDYSVAPTIQALAGRARDHVENRRFGPPPSSPCCRTSYCCSLRPSCP